MPHKAIFLDRDGTINEEVNYLSRLDQLKLIPGAVEGMRLLLKAGWRLVVVTNQSGVARGYYTEKDVVEIHNTLDRMLREEGVIITGFYYCPHHPDYGEPLYRKICSCRKPNLGMLRLAAKEHGLELRESLVVGDRLSDVLCGLALNGRAILVRTGYGMEHEALLEESYSSHVAVCSNLAEAAETILARRIPMSGKPVHRSLGNY